MFLKHGGLPVTMWHLSALLIPRTTSDIELGGGGAGEEGNREEGSG
jgi:hypothetical protein